MPACQGLFRQAVFRLPVLVAEVEDDELMDELAEIFESRFEEYFEDENESEG